MTHHQQSVDPSIAWMLNQIHDDLVSVEPKDISSKRLDELMEQNLKTEGKSSLIRYRISNQQIVQIQYYDYPKERPFNNSSYRYYSMTQCLQYLLTIAKIPDVDFVLSLHDSIDEYDLIAPVLTFAKNSTLKKPMILIPDFEILNGHLHMLQQIQQGIEMYPWESKIPKAIWRGSMTGATFTMDNFLDPPRSQLISISLNHPQKVDAGYIKISQCVHPEKIAEKFLHYFKHLMPINDHLAYKYQILVDGNTCTYSRAVWQLFSNCIIFKHESPHIQWYYQELKPHIHYIPCKNDFSDLVEKLTWADHHEDEVKQVIRNANNFANQHLQQAHAYQYLTLLLQEYAKRQA